MMRRHATEIMIGVSGVFLISWVEVSTSPVWASQGFKKGATLVIQKGNPQSLPQEVNMVKTKNIVLTIAQGQRVSQLNVIQGERVESTQQKQLVPLKVRQWIKKVSEPMWQFPDSPGLLNTKIQQQQIQRALELGYQNVPERVKEWMSYVRNVTIVNKLPNESGGSVDVPSGTIFVKRSFLDSPPEGVSPEANLLAVIVHEARHLWQVKSKKYILADPEPENEYNNGCYQRQTLMAEKDAYTEEYKVMQALGFPEEVLARQKWLVDNIGVGNTLVDRYVTGIASDA